MKTVSDAILNKAGACQYIYCQYWRTLPVMARLAWLESKALFFALNLIALFYGKEDDVNYDYSQFDDMPF